MANTYDSGDRIRTTGTWTNSTGATVDPTVIICEYKAPSGTTTVLVYGVDAIVRSTRGTYYTDVSLDEAGTWFVRWEGTGAAEAAAESYWVVRESEF